MWVAAEGGVADGHAGLGSGSLSSEQAKAALDGLAGQLQGLEAELATASYFLPAYDQRSTKCTYKEMQAEVRRCARAARNAHGGSSFSSVGHA